MNLFRRIIVNVLQRMAARPALLAQRIELGSRRRAYEAWLRDRGDVTRRLDYILDRNATVWDIGGFEGQWTSDIVARFGCRIHVFEPAPAAAELIRRRFARNLLVTIHEFALGDADGTMELALAGDASSFIAKPSGHRRAQVQVRDVVAVWSELAVESLGLLKINIEGGEYQLLERLITSGCIAAVNDVQVQFHDFVPEAYARRERIASALARTHVRTWCYDFVWENWRRRDAGVR